MFSIVLIRIKTVQRVGERGDNQINTYEFSIRKAKQLLAEAGFKGLGHDGFVEDPFKRTFIIHFDYITGSGTSEKRAAFLYKVLRGNRSQCET